MKLTSTPKPVKFRIVSGGEEHSSLDSLKHCFNIPDLQVIEKQFKQWINRQGTEGNLIARNLEARFPDFSKISSMDDYLTVYRIFYQKEFDDNKISNLVQLLEYWYKKGVSNNVNNLIKLGFEKDHDITLFCYHKKIRGLTDDWVASLKKVNSSEADKLILERKRFQRLGHWGGDVEQMKKRVFFYWEDEYFMADNYSEKETDIMNFVRDCKKIVKYKLNYDETCRIFHFGLKAFSHEDKFYTYREKDFLFDAKIFVLLILYKYDEYKCEENFKLWKTESMKVYPPSKYLFINYEHIESYDKEGFKYKNKYEQIELFVLNHLFEF